MKLLHISLRIAEFLISALFILSAGMKLGMPVDKLSAMYPWTGQMPVAFVRTMGVTDLLGGIGILVPVARRYAAIGIVLLMICACIFHISRAEGHVIGFNIVVGLIAGSIAWRRLAR